ncbi:carboxymuconolactone decarboxylase family protein [Hyphomonas johnsonii]|uniref:Fusion protein n=1 Tax=Hyphomonas johnsonii MHS-2 TaxID=1280950 RepID=A0A059FNH8_9PROT|nr:carboxymuconolactone decarboxylase family protein [Hyphomonas johnsonii]KCZ92172.1 fusion protein [Hyphomonas johnsonii MHS-2]
MRRITPASEEALASVAPILSMAEAAMGFVPNSMKVMARQPAMLQGFAALAGAIMGPGSAIPRDLVQMIANVTSQASGCRYCQAHTAHGAERQMVPADKIAALWDYETSALFTPAERAALSLAQAAGSVPNETTDAHFEALKQHFNEDEIVGIVGVIALFGFLNRWNDTLATTLEDGPLDFALSHLTAKGWEIGNHG